MIIQFQDYLTFENIYLWTNFGILPFWLMLIIIPNSKFTAFFVNSVILPLILSTAYIYVVYQAILLEEANTWGIKVTREQLKKSLLENKLFLDGYKF